MKRTGHGRILSVVMSAAIGIAVTACGATSGGTDASSSAVTSSGKTLDEVLNGLYKAAKAEGELVWYTATPEPANTIYAKAFEEKYPGIKVEMYRAPGTEVLAKYELEFNAGTYNADVLSVPQPGYFQAYVDQGWVMPYKVFEYDKFPKSARLLPDYPQYYALSAGSNPQGPIVYNTDLLKRDQVPTSFKDLANLDPSVFEGKIITNDPRVYPHIVIYAELAKEGGREVTKHLGDLGAVVATSSTVISKGVVSGEYALTPWFNMTNFGPLKKEGAPIDFIVAKEGIELRPNPQFITSHPSHPNAAKLFQEFIYTKEGQELWSKAGAFISPRSDVPLLPDLAWTKDAKVLDIDYDAIVAKRDQITKEGEEDYQLK